MFTILSAFIEQLINDFFSGLLGELKDIVGSLFKSTFFIETLPGLDSTVLSVSIVQNMTKALYMFMVFLLAVKVIWKGVNVYILWRDGESETPPGEMAIGAIYAMITAVAFPLVYEGGVNLITEIAATVLKFTNWAEYEFSGSPDVIGLSIDLIDTIARNSVSSVMVLVFIIVLIVLIFKLLTKGVELLIWRLGFPLAVIGLINSDGGAFKAYAQVLLKELATVLAQYFCLIMGICISSSGSITALIMGIAFEIAGISMPKILAQFLSPSGNGGGIMQKVYAISMAARAVGA